LLRLIGARVSPAALDVVKARTAHAFLPGVNSVSEALTGAPWNCGTRPVGFCEKGERTAAITSDFT
jgi:hypothetical protein